MKTTVIENMSKGEYISPSCACINIRIEDSILSGYVDATDNTITDLGEVVDFLDDIWM